MAALLRKVLCQPENELKEGGSVSAGYERVQQAFTDNFRAGLELGAQVVVYVKGEKVVDIWGSSSAHKVDYDGDTMQVVWSSSKTVESMMVALLVDQGKLAYSDPIAKHWPAFAQHGKADITVAELMRHESGLDIFARPVTLADMEDFLRGGYAIAENIEATEAQWSPESRRCYHAITRGMVTNELIRKVTGGEQTVGSMLKEVTDRLGLTATMKMGVKAEDFEAMKRKGQVATLVEPGKLKALRQVLPALLGLDREGHRQIQYFKKGSWAQRRWLTKSIDVGVLSAADGPGGGNHTLMAEFESPSCNLQTNARALATLFRHFISRDESEQLLRRETLLGALHAGGELLDVGLGAKTRFCDGGWSKNAFGIFDLTATAGDLAELNGWYGWMGWGGSMIMFNPGLDVVFAYTMTAMSPSVTGDGRTKGLVKALQQCLLATLPEAAAPVAAATAPAAAAALPAAATITPAAASSV